jgi:hypothetical protein
MDARYKIAEAMMRGVGQPMAAFPDQRQDADMALRGMASDLYQADQKRAQDYRAGIKEAILQSWPAELAKSAYGAVTLPGDVYAGKVNPMSDEAVGRAAEFAGLMTLGAGAVPAGRNEMRMGIKAYHGSPHDFDRFDMSKIGTGEGAQAYGHGLYFAGNENVAKYYREALSAPTIDGAPVKAAGTALSQSDDDLLRSIIAMEKTPQNIRWRLDRVNRLDLMDKLDEMVATGRLGTTGKMYEVDLNTSPDRLLDFDARVSQQPQSVQKFFDGALTDDDKAKMKIVKDKLGVELSGGMAYHKALGTPVGQSLSSNPKMAADLAARMRSEGIDGIQYLDKSSRAGRDGSRNYVMFDDKLVQILRKYGVATAAALPAAALAELGMSREEAKRSF